MFVAPRKPYIKPKQEMTPLFWSKIVLPTEPIALLAANLASVNLEDVATKPLTTYVLLIQSLFPIRSSQFDNKKY